MKSNTIFRALAYFVSVYHIVLGLIGAFAPAETVVKVAAKVYGATVTVNPEFAYMAKFIAAYMIVFGFMAWILASKPKEYSMLVWPIVLLFAIRIFDRLAYFDLLQAAFGSDMSKNMTTIVPIALISLGLVYFRPKR